MKKKVIRRIIIVTILVLAIIFPILKLQNTQAGTYNYSSSLRAGDYVYYDTGVSSVGSNGKIICRVLYTSSSTYGLQIMANSNIANITLGINGSTYGAYSTNRRPEYNNAIKILNDTATNYLNTTYATDARCVGSVPTLSSNGTFTNKNSESNSTIQLAFSFAGSTDSGCRSADSNYQTDFNTIQSLNLVNSNSSFWVASRGEPLHTSYYRENSCQFYIRDMGYDSNGLWNSKTCTYKLYGDGGDYTAQEMGFATTKGFRPVFALKDNLVLASGNGTSSNPYTIGVGSTITFDNQGAEVEYTQSTVAIYGGSLPSITKPIKTGYTFGGYYTEVDGQGTQYYNASGSPVRTWDNASDTILYAKWTATKNTVTFNNQSATSAGTSAVTATYGELMPDINIPSKTGYTFGGFYTSANGVGTQYYNELGNPLRTWDKTSNTTLYAKWTANTYTITLDEQNGTIGTTSITATYGQALPSITKPEKTGYTFGGYYISPNGQGTQYYTASGNSVKNWDKTQDTTLYAKWTPNTYTVSLNTNGGTVSSGNISSYTYGTGANLPTYVVKTGCTFAGWYDNSTFLGNPVTYIGPDEMGNKTFYAKWEVNTYSITYYTNGGTINGDYLSEYTYGTQVNLPTDVTKEGYSFLRLVFK